MSRNYSLSVGSFLPILIALGCAQEVDGFDILVDLPKEADVVVSGIMICDSDGLQRKIGKGVKLFHQTSTGEFRSNVDFLNQDRTQVLSLISHPGGGVDEVNELRVRTPGKTDGGLRVLKDREFVSAKGIHLGMSSREVTGILGHGKLTRGENSLRIDYVIDFGKNQWMREFSETCGAPDYFGKYIFIEDRLVEFHVGSEVP